MFKTLALRSYRVPFRVHGRCQYYESVSAQSHRKPGVRGTP